MRVRPAAVRTSTASGTSSRSRAPTQSALHVTLCGCQPWHIHSHHHHLLLHHHRNHHHHTLAGAAQVGVVSDVWSCCPHPHLHPHPKQTQAQTRVQIPQLVDTIPTLPRLAYVLPAWIRGPPLHPHEAHPTCNGPASAAGGLESLGYCLRMPSITALLITTSTSRLLQLPIRSTPAPCACSTRNPKI